MRLKPGQVVRKSSISGHEVTLRAPRSGDLDECLRFINILSRENTMVLMNRRVSRVEEKKWLSSVLAQVRDGERIHLLAIADGHVVGAAEIRRRMGKERHAGTFAISILDGYRDAGLGKLLMNETLRLAKGYGLRLVTLEVFVGNLRAEHLYKKFGFRQVGRMPKMVLHNGKYIDTLVMVKEI